MVCKVKNHKNKKYFFFDIIQRTGKLKGYSSMVTNQIHLYHVVTRGKNLVEGSACNHKQDSVFFGGVLLPPRAKWVRLWFNGTSSHDKHFL